MFKENNKKRKNTTIYKGIIIIRGFLIFSYTACFAIQKDPSKQRKPINTNNVANLLTQLTKSVTTYNDSKYDLSAHKLSTNLF
jgi:hypothetical protein